MTSERPPSESGPEVNIDQPNSAVGDAQIAVAHKDSSMETIGTRLRHENRIGIISYGTRLVTVPLLLKKIVDEPGEPIDHAFEQRWIDLAQ